MGTADACSREHVPVAVQGAEAVASLTSLCPPKQTQDHAVLQFWGLSGEVLDPG